MSLTIHKLEQLPEFPTTGNELVLLKQGSKVETYLSTEDGSEYKKVISSAYEPNLLSPKELPAMDNNVTGQFHRLEISNYDCFLEYNISCLRGSISVSSEGDNILEYLPPSELGEEIIIINGKQFPINIVQAYSGPDKPYVNYPYIGDGEATIEGLFIADWGGYQHIGFEYPGSEYSSIEAIYQISTDPDFINIVLNETINRGIIETLRKSKLIDISLLEISPSYYFRVKYVETAYGGEAPEGYRKEGKWSNTSSFKWKKASSIINGPYYEGYVKSSELPMLNTGYYSFGKNIIRGLYNSDPYDGSIDAVFISDPTRAMDVNGTVYDNIGSVSFYDSTYETLSFTDEIPYPINFLPNPGDTVYKSFFGNTINFTTSDSGYVFLLVGAKDIDDKPVFYLYQNQGTDWFFVQEIKPDISDNTSINDIKVCLNNNDLIIADPNYINGPYNGIYHNGKVIHYKLNNDRYEYNTEIKAFESFDDQNYDYSFGYSICLGNQGLFIATASMVDGNDTFRIRYYLRNFGGDFEYNTSIVNSEYGINEGFGKQMWTNASCELLLVTDNKAYTKGVMYAYGVSTEDGMYLKEIISTDKSVINDQMGNYLDAIETYSGDLLVTLTSTTTNKTHVYLFHMFYYGNYDGYTLIDDLYFNDDPDTVKNQPSGGVCIVDPSGERILVGNFSTYNYSSSELRNVVSLFQYLQNAEA